MFPGSVHIVIASDHAGFRLKQDVVEHLRSAGFDVEDQGTFSEEPVNYPWICATAARRW